VDFKRLREISKDFILTSSRLHPDFMRLHGSTWTSRNFMRLHNNGKKMQDCKTSKDFMRRHNNEKK